MYWFATGRNPNTEGLGLELTALSSPTGDTSRSTSGCKTTAPGVWAIGEVAGSPQFTHINVGDFRVVHANF